MNFRRVGTASTVGRGNWYALCGVCGEPRGFFFSFLNSFLTPAFLWSQSNLSWKGSLNAIWSKLCPNRVTKARAAYAMFVALGLTKAWSSEAEALCFSWVSNTRVCRRFCLPPGRDGARPREASLPPTCPPPLPAEPPCRAEGCWLCRWGEGSAGGKSVYRVRETAITSWWVLVFKFVLP